MDTDKFPPAQMPGLSRMEIGGGQVVQSNSDAFELGIPALLTGYANAQIDDYQELPRRDFSWRAPISLFLEAKTSTGDPQGTFGFGFWNDPFSLSLGLGGARGRLPQMPKAIWYFYGSEPNDFGFSPGVPGHGWKAAILNGSDIHPLLLAPMAALGGLAARFGPLRETVVWQIKKRVDASEQILETSFDRWHSYEIRCENSRVEFIVDGVEVLTSRLEIETPLGFLAWIDNQYAILNSREGIRFGTLPLSNPQSLHLRNIQLNSISMDDRLR